MLRARRAAPLARTPGNVWRSFWWSIDAYATAWLLLLPRRSGGIPARVRSGSSAWLTSHPGSESARKSACQLLASVALRPGCNSIATNFRGDDLLHAFGLRGGALDPSPVSARAHRGADALGARNIVSRTRTGAG